MAEQFNAEWARGIIDSGIQRAQGFMEDPSQIEGLLQELQQKLLGVPESLGNAFTNVPLMAQMVKSYITREYTEVSPKVIISLISAFLYLVKKEDLIPDNKPVVGLVDDLAVAAIAMVINEPELKAYALWREQNGLKPADSVEDIAPADGELADAEPIEIEAVVEAEPEAEAESEMAMPEYADRESAEEE